eukprot:CAMPEP_0173064070 /NCGR_PEP_ID=MMETSP1102-20130122/4782_1 /TAXON_ID=49646 /ORGANISM="Geminigera sp., Strain Caron Lab Isolate" /LENGTH=60 /DNA_ID=CAMNT_0013931037 /DNA_START=41 /DNA_END=220 /DNA_ORIENTATION=+
MPKKNAGSRCVIGLEAELNANTVLRPAFGDGLSLFLSAVSSCFTTSSGTIVGDGAGGDQL